MHSSASTAGLKARTNNCFDSLRLGKNILRTNQDLAGRRLSCIRKNRIRFAIDGKSSGFSICGIVFPSLSSSFPSFGNVDPFLGMSKFFKFFKRQPHRRMSITRSRIYRLETFKRFIQKDGHVFLDCKRANAARSVSDELFHNV